MRTNTYKKEETYTFSFYRKEETPVLKRRPWWNLFGKDSIEFPLRWNRKVIKNLSEQESYFLIRWSSYTEQDTVGKLVFKLLQNEAQGLSNIQLEQDIIPISVTSSEYVEVGKEKEK